MIFGRLCDTLSTVVTNFGPQSDGSFSLSSIITAGADSMLYAPLDCTIRIYDDPMGNQFLALFIEWENAAIDELRSKKILCEAPSHILIKSIAAPNDTIVDFIGISDTYITRYLDTAPRKGTYDPNNAAHRQKYLADLRAGKIGLSFKAGESLGVLKKTQIELSTLTTIQLRSTVAAPQNNAYWPEIERRNFLDTIIFFSLLATSLLEHTRFLSDGEKQTWQTWTGGNNFPSRIVLEFRDEHNSPIDSRAQIASAVRVSSNPLLFDNSTSAQTLNNSVNGLLVLEGASTDILLQTIYQSGGATPDEMIIYANLLDATSNQGALSQPLHLESRHLVVQVLRPADWFSAQTAQVAAGWNQLARFTFGNALAPLIDGEAYFSDLVSSIKLIDGNRNTDFIHITGWNISGRFDLAGPKTTLVDLFGQPTSNPRAKKLKLLKYDLPAIIAMAVVDDTFESTIIDELTSFGAQAHLDDTMPTGFAHHMKVISVNNASGHSAYCGGMDIVKDRLTGSNHSLSDTFNAGLHDVSLKILGPAAKEIEDVFWMRWHSNGNTSSYSKPTPLSSAQPGFGSATQIVQVACTIPKSPRFKIAVNGDQTIMHTILLAIENAKQYIYIEDQYFWSPLIAKKLRNKVNDLEFIIIVVPLAGVPIEALGHADDDCSIQDNINNIVNDTFTYASGEPRITVTSQQLKEKMKVCYLKGGQSNVYIHAKLLIIDDIFVSCGSANLDSRGLASASSGAASTECNIFSIDESLDSSGARKFAKDFRIKLWSEHLSKDEGSAGNFQILAQDLDDPVSAFHKFWKVLGQQSGKITIHPSWPV